MPLVSVLLPSIRQDSARRVVELFDQTQGAFDYEIVLVSPFEILHPRVVNVLETERGGVVRAMGAALAAAASEHIVLWSDDALPAPGCLEAIHRFVVDKPSPFVAGFSKRERSGRVNEQWSVYSKLYVGWLCASRRTIAEVGGLLDPVYKNYWSDPDFCMRIWDAGGSVAVCPDAWIEIDQIDDVVKSGNLSASFDLDTRVFFDRWHGKYGRGRPRVWWRINTPIPSSPMGHLKAILRQVPFLKQIKDLLVVRARLGVRK